jgi:DNA-binding SARP family transcriptional activator
MLPAALGRVLQFGVFVVAIYGSVQALAPANQLPFVLTSIDAAEAGSPGVFDGAAATDLQDLIKAFEAAITSRSGAPLSPRIEAAAALCRTLLGLEDARRSLVALRGSERSLVALIEDLLSDAPAVVAEPPAPVDAKTLPLRLGAFLDQTPPRFQTGEPPTPARQMRVCLLGRFELEIDGRRQPAWRSRRARQLFEFLLLNHRDEISRHKLMGLFWPDHSEERAENNLSLTVMTLRRLLGQQRGEPARLIGFRAGTYYIEPDQIWLDVDEFEAGIDRALHLEAAGEIAAAGVALDGAIALYGGDLLPGELYEDWTLSRRQQLQDRFADALQHRGRIARGEGNYDLSIRHNRRLLDLDPAFETAHRQLILDYLQTGQRSRAVQQMDACRQALRRHVGAEPDAETRAVFARLGA